MPANWEHFSHGADVGVRGFGATPAQAFEQAALALTAVIAEPRTVRPGSGPVQVSCSAPDLGILLADWLNALIYQMAVRQMLFSRFEVEIEGEQLTARIWGETLDAVRHQPAVEIKGATYTGLEVVRENGRWKASCIVDV